MLETVTESHYCRIKPDEVRVLMQERKRQLEELLSMVKGRISRAPSGTLRISQRGQYLQYYHRTEPKDTKGKYIKKSEIDLVKELAQKDYDQRIIIEIERQLEVINNCLEKYHPDKIDRVYRELHQLRKSLVCAVFQSDEEYVQDWIHVKYDKKAFADDCFEYYSDAGERVRSKSEIIIANKLLKMGVPYRYEYPITFMSGHKVHPDFYCLNIRTRKEFAWEHFGMMDNEEYANNAVRKIEEYEKNGYWIGKNLITTFETLGKPINVNILERMIQQYLL